MHPGSGLPEAQPVPDDRDAHVPDALTASPRSAESHGPARSPSSSPLMRKDTYSSTSTTATAATAATGASNETVATTVFTHPQTSPRLLAQAAFSVKAAAEGAVAIRRASRRRTGPLSAVQRERAALIRKLGACADCRRRRVACHPNHHNMTWEDAAKKYRSHSPGTPDLAPGPGRPPRSPAALSAKPSFHEHTPPQRQHHHQHHLQHRQEMDLDSPPHQLGRHSVGDTRIRTPLPSAPRLEKAASLPHLPGIDSLKPDLQSIAARVLTNSSRGRYSSVHVLLLQWHDDPDPSARGAMHELASVLESSYRFSSRVKLIPSSSDCKSSWRWLSRELTEFIDYQDQRDVLKVIYYSGHSFLDSDREMVLASSANPDTKSTVRWSGLQQTIEDGCSDALLLMDCAYFPSSKLIRKHGVFEILAASAGEDHMRSLGRVAFTQAVTELLHTRASQKFLKPLSVSELHARLLASYPRVLRDRYPERELLASFPTPLYAQIRGDARLPSVLLAPLIRTGGPGSGGAGSGLTSLALDPAAHGGPLLSLTFRLAEEPFDEDGWAEWLRAMPDGIRDVKVDGPYRSSTLR
ncbi:hypothetical protein VTK73DRAFT_5253 [Phialemonium thermophilum]|uniref:Uncharacterized protein n=1 Tax=Phialemonium thermophilum TaxID=223376 RepID=A0ABR3WPD4_9PEZI